MKLSKYPSLKENLEDEEMQYLRECEKYYDREKELPDNVKDRISQIIHHTLIRMELVSISSKTKGYVYILFPELELTDKSLNLESIVESLRNNIETDIEFIKANKKLARKFLSEL